MIEDETTAKQEQLIPRPDVIAKFSEVHKKTKVLNNFSSDRDLNTVGALISG